MRVSMSQMSLPRKPSSHAASSELIDSGRSTTHTQQKAPPALLLPNRNIPPVGLTIESMPQLWAKVQ
jgi:hypothetical protein